MQCMIIGRGVYAKLPTRYLYRCNVQIKIISTRANTQQVPVYRACVLEPKRYCVDVTNFSFV